MNATNYYVSTTRLVLQADPDSPPSWQDLYTALPTLRCCPSHHYGVDNFGLKQGKYSCVDQEQSLMHCVREPPVRTLHTRGSRTLDDLTTCDQAPVLRRPPVSTMCAKVAKEG